MSGIVFGLALGLNATSPAITSEQNPHMLAADRHYQELVYRHKSLLRADLATPDRLVLRKRQASEKRAETDTGRQFR